MRSIANLAETRILWISFVVTLLITFAFQLIVASVGGTLLDAVADPEQARVVIASMSESQRLTHAWITATLDVAYPAAYGALFVGSAYRFYPKVGRYLAWTMFVLVPIDLVEGVVQILALTDLADLLASKTVLTNLKQVLFLGALLFTFIGWLKWLGSQFFGCKNAEE
jgi:hypothetical protein